MTLNEDQGHFTFGKSDLPNQARTRIDQIINELKVNPRAVNIEIEGRTDNVGSAAFNMRLGLERAEAKQYMYARHQITLHKINVVSYGKEQPAAPNRTREGRAQNRRIVIRVLS